MEFNSPIQPTTIWVGNLSNYTQDQNLFQLFSNFGRVLSLERVPSGVYLTLHNFQSAHNAVSTLNGFVLHERKLQVQFPSSSSSYDPLAGTEEAEVGPTLNPNPNPRSNLVWLRNVPPKANIFQLHHLLSQHATVMDMFLADMGRSVLVTLESAEDASKVVRELEMVSFLGSKLKVEYGREEHLYSPSNVKVPLCENIEQSEPNRETFLQKPPTDENLHKLIDEIAEKVAINGQKYEEELYHKNNICFNPHFQFLFGGAFHQYYRWKVESLQKGVSVAEQQKLVSFAIQSDTLQVRKELADLKVILDNLVSQELFEVAKKHLEHLSTAYFDSVVKLVEDCLEHFRDKQHKENVLSAFSESIISLLTKEPKEEWISSIKQKMYKICVPLFQTGSSAKNTVASILSNWESVLGAQFCQETLKRLKEEEDSSSYTLPITAGTISDYIKAIGELHHKYEPISNLSIPQIPQNKPREVVEAIYSNFLNNKHHYKELVVSEKVKAENIVQGDNKRKSHPSSRSPSPKKLKEEEEDRFHYKPK